MYSDNGSKKTSSECEDINGSYDDLGNTTSRKSSDQEICDAYVKKKKYYIQNCLKYHPDKNFGN